VQNAGDTFTFGDAQTMIMCNACIMSSSENLETAMEFLNWFFTDDGYVLSNYGVEDLSFQYAEDGSVRFTDLIVNSEYSNKVQVKNMYGAMIFPYLKDMDAFYYTYADVEQQAIQIWNDISDESRLPSFDLDGDASSEFATLASDIVAYGATTVLKWLTGEVPLTDESWDEYVTNCNSMGLEDAVAIYQDGYDAFLAR
jgi:putative aldouronate transport system substrate-binding protein